MSDTLTADLWQNKVQTNAKLVQVVINVQICNTITVIQQHRSKVES